MFRFKRARGLPELRGGKLHGRHSVSAQGAHARKAQEEIYVDQEAVPATMNKSGLQIEAEKFSQDMQTPSTVLVWIFGSRTAILTRILGRAECLLVRLRDTSRI